ncbi:MAG: winged helix DNA-binding domain-containing protein, partial [Solirubrobacterales bacterium]|nr:winged helix DNA-binding domain-containing protein [Solirubrobacterales bacterium]
VPLQPGLGGRYGMLLIDGLFRGTWRITRHRDTAVLHVEPFRPVSKRDALSCDRDAIASEGERLLRFAVADAATHDIRFETS